MTTEMSQLSYLRFLPFMSGLGVKGPTTLLYMLIYNLCCGKAGICCASRAFLALHMGGPRFEDPRVQHDRDKGFVKYHIDKLLQKGLIHKHPNGQYFNYTINTDFVPEQYRHELSHMQTAPKNNNDRPSVRGGKLFTSCEKGHLSPIILPKPIPPSQQRKKTNNRGDGSGNNTTATAETSRHQAKQLGYKTNFLPPWNRGANFHPIKELYTCYNNYKENKQQHSNYLSLGVLYLDGDKYRGQKNIRDLTPEEKEILLYHIKNCLDYLEMKAKPEYFFNKWLDAGKIFLIDRHRTPPGMLDLIINA